MHEDPSSNEATPRQTAICTLFEGDYHFGLAAFLNSLVRAGFSGTVWIGYRGSLPPWLSQLNRVGGEEDRYLLVNQVRLVFLRVATRLHLTNYKPQFMLDLLANQARDCQYLWYFDPDIFLQARWSFFADWQRYGIALCQEIVDNILPHNAPLRHKWMKIGENLGLGVPQPIEHYYNGGMAGVPAAHTDFLEVWKRLLEYAASNGCDLHTFMPANRENPFHASDQDALNIAAMYSQHPLTTIGPQGMGFTTGEAVMYHRVGLKPWRAKFLRNAMAGIPPTSADKFFFTQVSAPIRAYSPFKLFARRSACLLAVLIGRFYRRG